MPNHSLTKCFNKLPHEIWGRIAQLDELKGRWFGGRKLNPQTLGRLKKSVLITSTGSSTRIEGSTLSDNDVERIIRKVLIEPLHDRDQQEVQSYYELLENVFSSWQGISLSVSTIKHFHKEILKYVEKDKQHRGEYKKKENNIGMLQSKDGSVTPLLHTTAPYLVEKEMHELIEWTREELTNKKTHPILIIATFIVEFLIIHPFDDGNGRLSRILTNLLLLQSGYAYVPYISHEQLIEEKKNDYYLALYRSQQTLKTKTPDITAWLSFFLSILLQQATMAIQLAAREHPEKLLSEKQLAIWGYIDKHEEITPRELEKFTGITRPTINQALDRLMKASLIERIGQGRGTRYRKIQSL